MTNFEKTIRDGRKKLKYFICEEASQGCPGLSHCKVNFKKNSCFIFKGIVKLIRQSMLKARQSTLEEVEKETIKDFINYIKYWTQMNKKSEWHPILIDSLEGFLEIRSKDYLNRDIDEYIKWIDRKNSKAKLKSLKENNNEKD